METNLFKVDHVHLHESKGSCKAFVTLRIAEVLVVKNIRVVAGKRGLFVAMPSEKYMDKKDNAEKYYSVAFPATKAAHQALQEAVLAAYHKAAQPA